MNTTGCLILGIIWIFCSSIWFLIKNNVMGIIWLCAGILELIVAFIRHNKDKKCK